MRLLLLTTTITDDDDSDDNNNSNNNNIKNNNNVTVYSRFPISSSDTVGLEQEQHSWQRWCAAFCSEKHKAKTMATAL